MTTRVGELGPAVHDPMPDRVDRRRTYVRRTPPGRPRLNAATTSSPSSTDSFRLLDPAFTTKMRIALRSPVSATIGDRNGRRMSPKPFVAACQPGQVQLRDLGEVLAELAV